MKNGYNGVFVFACFVFVFIQQPSNRQDYNVFNFFTLTPIERHLVYAFRSTHIRERVGTTNTSN